MVRNFYGAVVVCGLSLALLSSSIDPKGAEANYADEKFSDPPATPVNSKILHHRSARYQIFLTFDDGPSDGSRVIDRLSLDDSLDINVFIIGNNASRNQNNRRVLQDYRDNPFVEVGNHSYSHAKAHYQTYFTDPANVVADFLRNRDSLGLKNRIARLPGRNCFRVDGLIKNDGNGKQAADSLAQLGYKIFGWDLEWRNKASTGISTHTGEQMYELVQEMLEKQKTFSSGELIILLHDQQLKDTTLHTGLENFIRLIRQDNRFEFRHLSDYIGQRDSVL